jgi:hypothetical protein
MFAHVQIGATDLRYAPDFYAAYCRDPEGHKLCFVHARGAGPVTRGAG